MFLQGNINLIEAAVRHGVKKFVLVTSIGTGAGSGVPACHGACLAERAADLHAVLCLSQGGHLPNR